MLQKYGCCFVPLFNQGISEDTTFTSNDNQTTITIEPVTTSSDQSNDSSVSHTRTVYEYDGDNVVGMKTYFEYKDNEAKLPTKPSNPSQNFKAPKLLINTSWSPQIQINSKVSLLTTFVNKPKPSGSSKKATKPAEPTDTPAPDDTPKEAPTEPQQ